MRDMQRVPLLCGRPRVQYRSDTLSHASCSLRLGQPDRRERAEDIRRFNLVDALVSEVRECIRLESGQPLRCMLRVLPDGACCT
jgi:hypothetical protein